MRIGLFADTYYPRLNGVATSVRMLKENLEALGHDVFVFSTTDPEAPAVEHNVFRIPSVPFKTQRLGMFISPALYKDVKRLSLDVIHSHTEYTLGNFGRIIAKHLDIPFVHTMHTIYEDYTDYIIKSDLFEPSAKAVARKLTTAFCNSADKVIVPTDKIKDLMLAYGVVEDISVIPTGIPLDKFNADQTNIERIMQLQAELGIAAYEKVLINVGRVAHEKNLDEILLALKDYLPGHHDTKLLIVGDASAKEHLEILAGEFGMGTQVIFAGARSWDEIHLYYKLGDIFVSASTSETQGLTYIEAMASGLPVIAREDRCLDGVVIEGENGFAYRTTRELVQGIDYLLSNENVRAEFSLCSLSIAQAFSAKTYACRVQDVYVKLIDGQLKHILHEVS